MARRWPGSCAGRRAWPASGGDPDRRAGLGEGGVPRHRAAVPATRPGHLRRRRPRARAKPSTTSRSGRTGRCPVRRSSTRSPRSLASTRPGPGSGASAWAATTRPGWPARDARVRACIALSGPFSFGENWYRLPQLTRDAFGVRSKAATEKEAKRAADELTLAGRAGRITAPMLIVAGRKDQHRRLAGRPPAGRRDRRAGRAAAAGRGQSRLRQPALPAPALQRGLDGAPARVLIFRRAR